MFFKTAVQFLVLIVAVSGLKIRYALNHDDTLQVYGYTQKGSNLILSQKACIAWFEVYQPLPCRWGDEPNLRLLNIYNFHLNESPQYVSDLSKTQMKKLFPVQANCLVGKTPLCNLVRRPLRKRDLSNIGNSTEEIKDIETDIPQGTEPVPYSQDISTPASEETKSDPDDDDDFELDL